MACNKVNEQFIVNTNLTVVNAAVDIDSVKVNPGRATIFAQESSIKFATNRVYALRRTSIPITIVNAADTTVNVYTGSVNFQSGIYTMYLIGQAPTVETIIKEEIDFPFIRTDKVLTPADSVIMFRLINLSPNSVPLKITLATGATIDDNVPYKTFGTWRSITAKDATTTYVFQVRNAATGVLLTSFNFVANATNRFKNVSLIIKGLMGTTIGKNAFGVFAVNFF